MSAVWSLLDLTSNLEKSFEDWGLRGVHRTLLSKATDTVTFRHEAAFDTPLLFPVDGSVIIKKDGASWFYGRVTRTPRAGTAGDEGVTYELAGPWWYLD